MKLGLEPGSITQSGVSTVYGFDAYGRRVTETTGGSVLTKHYTASSDNPAWSSNNAGVTDFYVNSLGTGLNGTVHVDNGVKTVSLDVNDLRGNTVTRINLDTATTDSWVSFDEYGNRDTTSTGKLVTYDAYGQYERATTSQGLILMGARVYNPVTNQFTSPDPVTGGNETSYTYPNDPINKNDYTGLDVALSLFISVVSNLLSAFICATTAFFGCLFGSAIVAGVAHGIEEAMEVAAKKGSQKQIGNALMHGFAVGFGETLLFGAVGKYFASFVLKLKFFKSIIRKPNVIKKEPNMKQILADTRHGAAFDYAWDKTKKTYGWNW
jgi:RHS repeat-associated protein